MKRNFKSCILFSTADWDSPYWTNKQHTTKLLAQRDIKTLYVESIGLRTPRLNSKRDMSRIFRRLKRGFKGIHKVDQNIWVISPLIIPLKHHWTIVKSINRLLLNYAINHFCRKNDFDNQTTVIWTYHPFAIDYLDCDRFGSLVYHCVDDLSAIPGINADGFIRKEQELLKLADTVFTTSKSLYHKCSMINNNTYDFNNVVDWEHFSKAFSTNSVPEDVRDIPYPRLGYIGVLSDLKVDFELLLNLAFAKPEWNIILIGDEREGQNNVIVHKLKLMSNVYFLGYKEYIELPSYTKMFNIGLLPTLVNTYTDSMFPMKFYEYIASGLRIVSTPLNFINRYQNYVKIGHDSESFIEACQMQLDLAKLTIEESYLIVGENTWGTRMNEMLKLITFRVLSFQPKNSFINTRLKD